MAILNNGSIKVRVRGVTAAVRTMARASDDTMIAAIQGVYEAAEHLQHKIEGKFGTYQPTGGSGGGSWEHLSPDYRYWKKKQGMDRGPLILTGDMKNSFYIKKGGKGTIAASVASDDPKLPIHVYGTKDGKIPPRDPMLVTAVEQADECHAIVKDHVYRAWSKISMS